MKQIIRSLVVTLGVSWAVAAGAQGPGEAGSASVGSGNAVVPAVPRADKGAAAGVGPEGSASPGTSTQGEVQVPDSSKQQGEAQVPPAATGQPAPGAQASGGVAWYDKLANKEIEEEGNFWMPKAVNSAADDSDFMFYAIMALTIFFFVGITAATVYLTIKYRHRPGHKAEPSSAHNDAMEITWTVIPTIITVFLFWYGWKSYINVVTPPQKAVEIDVLAWRWNWQFTHYNGVTDSDLHVPVDTPVRLVMTSKDVLHAFYAPAMRVKQDIIPRRYTYSWFNATKPGTYRLTCAEYCGTAHAQMGCLQTDTSTGACLRRAVVVVHERGDYERYLADKEAESQNLPPVELGKKLYEKKGCNACHTVDGSPRVGPSFFKQFGTTISLSDGSKIPVDENYIRESLMSPAAKARPGYPPSMPSFEGQLKEAEVKGLIEYIKSLK